MCVIPAGTGSLFSDRMGYVDYNDLWVTHDGKSGFRSGPKPGRRYYDIFESIII